MVVMGERAPEAGHQLGNLFRFFYFKKQMEMVRHNGPMIETITINLFVANEQVLEMFKVLAVMKDIDPGIAAVINVIDQGLG